MAAFVMAQVVGAAWAHATQYRITELGPVPGGLHSRATAINDAGISTGYAPIDTQGNVGSALPVRWDSQGVGELIWTPSDVDIIIFDPPSHIPAAPGGIPAAINNLGQVAGRSNYGHFTPLPGPGIGEGHAFVWSPGQQTPLDITPSGSGGRAEATDINDLGKVVGSYVDGAHLHQVGYVWDATNGHVPLGFLAGGDTTRPAAINNAGTVVGTATRGDGRLQAFIWNAVDGIQPLGTLPIDGGSSSCRAINDLGQVVGNDSFGPFLWDSSAGFLQLNDPHGVFGNSFTPTDLNNAGQVVGSALALDGIETAVVWDRLRGQRRLEDELMFGQSGWELERATGINSVGQIVGVGYLNGERRGFLLTPVPEPASLILAAAAAILMIFFWRLPT